MNSSSPLILEEKFDQARRFKQAIHELMKVKENSCEFISRNFTFDFYLDWRTIGSL